MASPSSSTPTLEQATDLLATDPQQAESLLHHILAAPSNPKNEGALREKEGALLKLGELCRDRSCVCRLLTTANPLTRRSDPAGLAQVITSSHSLLIHTPKAKTAKLVRTLIDHYSQPPLSTHAESASTQINVTRENVVWAREEKRVFLRQSLEIRLGTLLFASGQHKDSLTLVADLLKELKRLDDKMVLTEVHLLESKIRHALSDSIKAKAALTSARTSANAIYCPPLLQAGLDMQSGVLHADDKDYKTAYSYFYESLEALSSQDDVKAGLALKYMLMCKVMLDLPEDVTSILNSKLAKRYEGRDTEAMVAVAKAHENRSLANFETALSTFKTELSEDPIVRSHLSSLYDTLLTSNLLALIEPYSLLDLNFISTSLSLPPQVVETKLSQMILDEVFEGVLDQGRGCVEIWQVKEESGVWKDAGQVVKVLSSVVESLFAKASQLEV